MSAQHVRWYTPLRSPSTDVAIHASMRVVERAPSSACQAGTGGSGRQNRANGGFAGLFANAPKLRPSLTLEVDAHLVSQLADELAAHADTKTLTSRTPL